MRNQSNLAENTIVIEPGSFSLRIGRAVENNPKRFPHCISRKPKLRQKPPIREPIIARPKFNQSEKLEHIVDQTKSTTNELFNLSSSSMVCTSEVPKLQTIQVGDPQSVKLFEWELDLPEDQDYFVLNEAFEFGLKLGHHINWPIRYGFFNPTTNYTSVLQDLQDIWTVALEKHVGIPRSNFNNYRVILVIEDVYKRSEIRHLTDLLLNRLRFGRVFLHQASVCATYGVGLPTACVINIGDQKTSVCCVEDGVAHTDARVTLSIGRSDVLRVFHSLILPEGFVDDEHEAGDEKQHKLKDFAYDRLSDVNDLRTCLDAAEQSAIEFICRQTFKQDDNPANSNQITETQPVCDQILVPLVWNHGRKQCQSLSIPISTIPIAHLLPFSAPQFIHETQQPSIDYPNYRCVFQLAPNQSSEPDDPFDDLYIALTARERRKRGTNQVASQNDPNAVDIGPGQEPEKIETELADLNVPLVNQINPLQSSPKEFANLPEAIWWSINQCSNLIASQMSIPDTNPSNPNPNQQSGASMAAGDEMRRRLLGCILLCGGGVSSAGSQFLERWLTRQLSQLVRDKWAGSTTLPSSPIVEIIKQTDRADLCWSGARLLLTTDLINDLWITPTEWRRFGSRAIREKAPFLW